MILKKYKGGGTSSYHPKLLLKVLIYGYLSNRYSSRKLEQAVSSNIYYMWLAGMQRPDHNTINRFRNDKLKGVLKEVFGQVVTLMVGQGIVDIVSSISGVHFRDEAKLYNKFHITNGADWH